MENSIETSDSEEPVPITEAEKTTSINANVRNTHFHILFSLILQTVNLP